MKQTKNSRRKRKSFEPGFPEIDGANSFFRPINSGVTLGDAPAFSEIKDPLISEVDITKNGIKPNGFYFDEKGQFHWGDKPVTLSTNMNPALPASPPVPQTPPAPVTVENSTTPTTTAQKFPWLPIVLFLVVVGVIVYLVRKK